MIGITNLDELIWEFAGPLQVRTEQDVDILLRVVFPAGTKGNVIVVGFDDGEGMFRKIVEMKHRLKVVRVAENQCDATHELGEVLANLLTGTSKVEELEASHHVSVGVIGGLKIAQILATENRTLKALGLANTQMNDYRVAVAFAEALKVNDVLHQLTLGSNDFTNDAGVVGRAFADSLPGSTLTHLSLETTGFTEKDAVFLATASNETLQFLNLRCNSLECDGIAALANGTLIQNLKVLNISCNAGYESAGEQLGAVIQGNRVRLTKLYVRMNYLGEGFFASLRSNCSLVFLDLSQMGLNDEDGEILGQVLSENKTIRMLNLASNSLGANSARFIAEPLKSTNQSLHSLNLNRNNLTKVGARAFADVLYENLTLVNLNMYQTFIEEGPIDSEETRNAIPCGIEFVNALLSSMPNSTTLRYLNLGDNNLSSEETKLLISVATFQSNLTIGLATSEVSWLDPTMIIMLSNIRIVHDEADSLHWDDVDADFDSLNNMRQSNMTT